MLIPRLRFPIDVDAQISLHHGVMICLYFYQVLWRISRRIRLTYPLQKLINELSIDVLKETAK